MLKMTLFDCVIGEKCCSVDEGQGIALFFCPQPGGFDSSKDPTAGNLPLKAKKKMLKVKVLKLCYLSVIFAALLGFIAGYC